MNKIITIDGIDCYEQNGTVYLRLETVARGLGFTQEKNGVEYVRWETINKMLNEIGFPNKLGKDDFIPESIFYRLAMKAKNAVAEAFQTKVAEEIIPSIRRHGAYMTPDTIKKVLTDPDTIIQLATQLKEEQEARRQLETRNGELLELNAIQNQQLAEMRPKAGYYDVILNCKDLVSATVIAKDFGWSAKKLNEFLHEKKVQFKQGRTWVLYQKYAEQGYTATKTPTYQGSDGEQHSTVHTYWTQKGRLFIYELMKKAGHLPLIEQKGSEEGA